MATGRKFCSFTRGGRSGLGIDSIPEDGFCISVFLIITETGNARNVLLGRINPDGPWDHIGALDRDRISAHSDGWMIPSCHLMYGEAPGSCAGRIAKEQLDIEELELSGPAVHSEVYAPRRFPGRKAHWDLEFLYRGSVDRGFAGGVPENWKELRFIDLNAMVPGNMVRSHEDILARLK